MKWTKLVPYTGWLVLVAVMLTACPFDTPDTIRARDQLKALQDAAAKIGMPAIVNFQEMRMMKDLYEKRDRGIATYVYLKDENGGLRCLGEGIGFALPYGTQYTSPENPSTGKPQAEPNGLFMPPTAESSWYMMRDPTDHALKVLQSEPRLLVFEGKLPCTPLDQ